METRIINKLKTVEKERGVEILFAVESGSRAWGFASPDSDYDIRFVYKQKVEDYLSLWKRKDTIEFMTEDDLDGSGWDLKKATLLMAKSNASFLGWLFSPVIYIDNGDTLLEMRRLANANFNPVSGFYHYHSMNKNFADKIASGDFTLKAYFYAIRTAMSANWILKNHTIPPVEFKQMYSLLDTGIAREMDGLIEVKAQTVESGSSEVSSTLIEVLKEIVNENEAERNSLVSVKPNKRDFDQFFIEQIK